MSSAPSAAPFSRSSHRRPKAHLALTLSLCLLSLLTAHAGQPTKAGESRDWPAYGGGPENTHYSTLAQINRENVSHLQVAWTFDTGDSFPGSEMECNPIVVGGVLYATSPKNNVVALDAATGKLRWRFDPNAGRKVVGKMRNRGVAYWAAENDRRIFFAARQYLYALNADTGRVIDAFGNGGRIDLRDDLGREARDSVTMTSPAVIYKDLVIIGSGVSETLPAAPGDLRAYDARTGNCAGLFTPFLTPVNWATKPGRKMPGNTPVASTIGLECR